MITYDFLSPETLYEEDVVPLRGLLEQLRKHPVDVDRERILLIVGQARVLIARNDARVIVGMGSLYKIHLFTRTTGRIECVIVDGSMRGQGIGRELVMRLITEAKRLDISRLFLTSRPSRVEANQLYQKLGFETYETNVYRMDV